VFTTPPALLFAVLASAAAAFLLQSPAATAAQGRTADDFQSSVARLDLTQGSVAFQPADGGDNGWVAAVVDRTLKIGDQLWADSDGAVEMHVGSAAVRMGHNTGVSFLNLSENLTQLQVSAGSVIVRLDKLDPDDAFEVTAPNLLIALLQPGTYEIDANPETHVTVVTVIAGEGQVTGGGQSWSIAPRQQATFSGMDTLTYNIKDAKSFPQTDFEKWSAQLDVNANGAAAEHTTGSSQAPPPILQALPEADWQTTAGGKQSFDSASVKPNKSHDTPVSNMDFGPGSIFNPTAGVFAATNWTLLDYLRFAYKLNRYQRAVMQDNVPKWVTTDRFDIQARVAGNPTKDQFRMMMQSLLADRFKLAVHVETQQLPVFALVLAKPGKTGQYLQPYSANKPCVKTPTVYLPGKQTQLSGSSGFPSYCGGFGPAQPSLPGFARLGGQNVSIAFIASSLTIPALGLDRPVVDRTGLAGNFDMVIEFIPQPVAPGPRFQVDPMGPTFEEALEQQAGLKLTPAIGPVDVFVFDHAEAPAQN
jgi:uncharacterized protein (TIGR03435 family)